MYVATIGMFDGVHRGHQFVLGQLVEQARRHGLQSLAITFDQTLRRDHILTPTAEKLRLLQQAGVDRTEVLTFTPELKSLTARQFMEQVLQQRLGVSMLLTGYDNRFGHDRKEGFDDYVRYGRELGISVQALPPLAGMEVSSSRIRQLLQEGHVEEAARCLGRPYALTGHVVHGRHVGSQLGYPTANIVPDTAGQLTPAPGVYAVRVTVLPSTPNLQPSTFSGMMNIGTRPTFDGHATTLEVHLLDFDGDLYGQALTVSFVGWLRAERRFDSIDALKEQLRQDQIQAEQQLR